MWHTIMGVDLGNNYFTIDGSHVSSFPKGCRIRVVGGKNSGNYHVTESEVIADVTFLTVSPTIPDVEAKGKLRKKKRHPNLSFNAGDR